MFRFSAERFQYIDDDDNVIGAFVKWTQACDELADLLAGAMTFLVAAAMGAYALASFGGPDGETLAIASFSMLGLAVVILISGRYICTERCELTFDGEGPITMPRGFTRNRLFGPQVLGDYRELDSVQSQEAEQTDRKPTQQRRYEVWFYFRNGASFPVAESLTRRQAHQVAVLLEQARADVREAKSRSHLQSNAAWVTASID